MCRNIRQLYNFKPPATDEEIKAASLQFVRKISGFNNPSKANEVVFNHAIDDVTKIVQNLLNSLVTNAQSKDREVEKELARLRNIKRFGK